ncbi:GSCFA domain-containing protein [Sulfitobacter pseudonitzschiae]|uniref:GSCFA domain-containing protein n=1 Tax=Pseudosulfitobacter pseudonitzschiae TaxID=1402135 RepID=A0A9Q2NT45_9RHOB|nr:GSCFA domain-containing protein [Pseudosulfitobacter pseudonitzschiae]MBM2291979.1 GSCFA domain-containing protein [Pseudosulfitobacter pseudonitzschiae]MBM2296897.1 GSCFA domain-containing protein [Pseudosulfitobacter pseudonitzschiae]MBM2301811.1 GSCFA domain-containing protein [Pseudosulfitobacter pseudonitzschiae]MBM2311593.1 GSCFA domain-containing protein [Pseudosulfitobacter pseudonitzschiae]MBM2316507.1 GSCFA domain-containing protein [Pseudosulfitobacter pseudonitzschiae]
MTNPYDKTAPHGFWKTGVEAADPAAMYDIHAPKWQVQPEMRVATAGSCFARHLARFLTQNGFDVIDAEPAPEALTPEQAEQDGFGQFSARYGNIYTAPQLEQLLREAQRAKPRKGVTWKRGDRVIDAMRPRIPAQGFDSAADMLAARGQHLAAVREMIEGLDLFVFTLGLTEAWEHRQHGTVYPVVPGAVGGTFDPDTYAFRSFGYADTMAALENSLELIGDMRGGRAFRVLLTVSPVPLTATATGGHVLPATVYSKSVLRAVAGDCAARHDFVDYFPSYEIITNPAARSRFYDANLRTVTEEGVRAVMKVFFHHHGAGGTGVLDTTKAEKALVDDGCEEALLDAFAPGVKPKKQPVLGAPRLNIGATPQDPILFAGNSHLASFKDAVLAAAPDLDPAAHWFVPIDWTTATQSRGRWPRLRRRSGYEKISIRPEYRNRMQDIDLSMHRGRVTLCLVGRNFIGDQVLRAHGDLTTGQPGLRDGKKVTQQLPMVGRDDAALEDFYRGALQPRVAWALKMLMDPIFKRAIWVASPDLPEHAARVRLGNAFVDSGSYRHHQAAALRATLSMMPKQDERLRLIQHDPAMRMPSGFIRNEFATHPSTMDIHANAAFYRGALEQMFGAGAYAPSLTSAP